jgi:hypothetical protein
VVKRLQAEATRVCRHLDVFRRLESIAEDRLTRGRHDDAAAWAQIAADYAWRSHPGVFVSTRLEAVLAAVGREALSPADPRRPPNAPPRRVLHVLTEAGAIGGHSRLVRRWIEQDEERSHSLVLTRQRGATVPAALAGAVRGSGGEIQAFGDRGRLVPRARELRAAAAGFDVAVLHVHPFDVLPAIALADESSSPPVVFVNHADHVFWIGSGVADAVACIRESGLRLALERRGLSAATCTLLPIPIAPASRTSTRAEAKCALGLRSDAVLLLTVAQAQKFAPVGEVSFLDLVTPVVETHPHAVVRTVGPVASGEWEEAGRRTGGRIQALGPTEDVARFYEAADVYLDSYPLASLTSLLEAGSFGAPVLSFRPHGPEAEVLAADDPALGDGLVRAASVTEYRAALSRLISDPSVREQVGGRTRARIEEAHVGPGWTARLDEVYARARRLGRAAPLGTATVGPPTTLDALLSRLHSASGWSIPLHETVRSHVDCLSAPASAWTRILLARQLQRFFGAEERRDRLERRLFPSREAA